MKKVILVVFIVPYLLSAQVNDGFETGSLNNWVQNDYDRWKADTVSALSGRFSLHHVFDNPEAGNDRIAIALKNLHPDEGTTRWSFRLRHGYDPSSSNNWMVFLMSQSGSEAMMPSAYSGAFAIGVNITGSDDTLRLVRISNGIVTNVTNCGINWQTEIGMSAHVIINVERSPEGAWKIDVYRKTGELIRSSSAFDPQLFAPAWFGISYRYSSTRDRLLWVDDVSITGTFYSDTVPPAVEKVMVSGRNAIFINFTEEPAGIIDPGIFKLNGGEAAIKAEKTDPLTYCVTFGTPFINRKNNTLLITRLCDKSGNCSEGILRDFVPVWAVLGDVVITEIMADPVPVVSLPEAEFIEIANRTDSGLDLRGWTIETEDQAYKFPDCIIDPNEILILSHRNDVSFFKSFGRSVGFSTFPLLTDAGKLICLRDSSGDLIHGVEYSSRWYDSDLKAEGGWSLEMIDTGAPFYYEGNWTASLSKKGGTPGSVNSVTKDNPDPVFEGLLNVFAEDSNTVTITFSEPVPMFSDILKMLEIEGKAPVNVLPSDKLLRSFTVTTEKLTFRHEYDLVIPEDLSDFAGNRITRKEAVFGLTEAAEKGEVLFNEVLFNPLPGSADFVELFNASEKAIDASRLFLVSVGESGDTSGLFRVSEVRRCILPSSYYAISEERNIIADSYPGGEAEFIFSSPGLPSLPDDKGHLLLLNRELVVIDEVIYSEKMHNALLSSSEGVSLEKSSPLQGSTDTESWHSASGSSGWGTPGKENSIVSEFPESDEQAILSSSRITPDGDGFEDILSIKLIYPENGNIVSITVFDEAGNLVKKVVTNLLSGPESIILWDGTAEDGSQVRNGIYVILITSFNETGKSARWKKVCAVIR